MKKITLPQMIDYYRKQNNLTMKELGQKMGKSESAVSRWIKGERSPMVEDLDKLSVLFNIPIEILMFGGSQNNDILPIYNKLEPQRQEKVYNFAEKQLEEQNSSNIVDFAKNEDKYIFDWRGYVSAGTGEYLDGVTSETIELREDQIPDGADFALTVNGDSMKPMFRDHDLIFVEETPDLQNGSIGVVIVNDEAYVKKVYYNLDGMTLVSLNTEYEDIELKSTDEIKVIGKVVI